MEGRSKLQNLDNYAAVSCENLWTNARNLAKFTAENCGPAVHWCKMCICFGPSVLTA